MFRIGPVLPFSFRFRLESLEGLQTWSFELALPGLSIGVSLYAPELGQFRPDAVSAEAPIFRSRGLVLSAGYRSRPICHV